MLRFFIKTKINNTVISVLNTNNFASKATSHQESLKTTWTADCRQAKYNDKMSNMSQTVQADNVPHATPKLSYTVLTQL